jgi:hypothetical protein
VSIRHARRAFCGGGIGVHEMAVKELPKAITVKKGPLATGTTFAFRAFKNKVDKDGKEIDESGNIEVGDSPVTIKLDTADAIRVSLGKSVLSMVQKGYLTDVNAPPRKKFAEKGE